MTNTVLRIITSSVLILGICTAFIVGSLGFTSGAEARDPKVTRMNEIARECGQYQDGFDRAIVAWADATTADARAGAEADIASNMNLWSVTGCDKWYGGIGVSPVDFS